MIDYSTLSTQIIRVENQLQNLGIEESFIKIRAALKQAEINERVLERIRSGEDWFPIESAPKDGTPIIVIKRTPLKEFGQVYGFNVHWVSKARWYEEFDKWHDGCDTLALPTHWKPLDGEKHIEMLMKQEIQGEMKNE